MPKVTSKLPVTIPRLDSAERQRIFDAATARQRAREVEQPPPEPTTDRGWTREELYTRDGAG